MTMHWLPLLALAVACAHAQLTAKTTVAPHLRECYTNGTLLNRNNLPPTTIAVLIDIIRKIEDNPNVTVDIRQLSSLLLHTYRQDGIEFHQPETQGAVNVNVLPYSPTFHSFYRHQLLLTHLIPNSLQILANDTLSPTLKCALHYMLSTTVDGRQRGDEGACNTLAQMRALRTPRRRRGIADYELVDRTKLIPVPRQYDAGGDTTSGRSERQVEGTSTCPILGGVVDSPFGALSAGNLIAGIAAGAQPQHVSIVDLLRGGGGSVNTAAENMQNYVTSLYPATLAGDLAEAVLVQGVERGSSSIVVGSSGGWNSTRAKRHYMLQSRLNVEMTDPEIRGGLDGFLLGATMNSVFATHSITKLSQLLDMYYSPRNGVFNSNVRACNRQTLSQQTVTETPLVLETQAFAAVLDTVMPLRGTLTSGLSDNVESAVTNLISYAANNMHDVTCASSELTAPDYRHRTNLYLAIDSAWAYDTVYPAVSYILDSIEVGKFGSSVTLLSAFDGSVIVNTTFSLADFHTDYTLAKHQSLSLGVNLENTLSSVRTLMSNQLEYEKAANYVGGNSSVLLFLLNTGNLQNNDQVYEQARLLNDTAPDLRILYATSSNQFDTLWNLVRDMHRDVHTVALTTGALNAELALEPVLARIHTAGRRIVNPACGSEWHSDSLSGSRQFEDFLEPGYINFYSVSPNYFYENNDNRRVRITRTASGVGSLRICHSRVTEQPRAANSTQSTGDLDEMVCQTLSSGSVDVSLQGACDGRSTISSCPSLYISVQSIADGVTTLPPVCTINACRFPYNIRYQVQIEDFGCFSSGNFFGPNIVVVLFALLGAAFKCF